MGACAALGITNQDTMSEDLENDPFLNSALQRSTCELYYRFSSFLAPLSVAIIMSRHYSWGHRATPGPAGPSEHHKNGGISGVNEGPKSAERNENDQKLINLE